MDEPTTITDVLERLAALQRELPGVKVALPGCLVVPAQFPAFVNRVGMLLPEPRTGVTRQTWTVHMRLLVGTLLQGYDFQQERALYALLRAVPAHFAARARLELGGEPLRGLAGPTRLGPCTGVIPIDDGLYAHVGAEFPLDVAFLSRDNA